MSLIKVDPVKAQAKAAAERIKELKQLLVDTDYKVLPDYDKESEAIKTQRQSWREEIRTLEQGN